MDDVSVMPTRHRLEVRDYHRMVDAGILGKYDHVELIDGEIIDMAPIGQDHAGAVNGLAEALFDVCKGRGIVSVQNSIQLDRWSAPQPDFAVFRFRADRYRTGSRPGPADCLLLVEVSGSSLRYDKTVKMPLYAVAGIQEFWIVDLAERVVTVHRKPDGPGYAERTPYGPGDRITLAMDPEITVSLDLLFG